MNKMNFARIILDANIKKPLDYAIPQNLKNIISSGMLVEIPLRGSLRQGYILELKEKSNIKKTYPIKRIISEKIFSKDLFSLALWMSNYYMTPLSKILRCIVPSSIKKEIHQKTQVFLSSLKTKKELLKICHDLNKKSPSQVKVLQAFLNIKKGIFLTDLIKDIKTSKSPIDTLIKKKILSSKKIITEQNDLLFNADYFFTKPKTLTQEQQVAFDNISKDLEKDKFSTHLIYGVTSSGKTEIYLQAIQKALDLNKTAIMLVPEIALTSQTIERFKARFKEKIAIFHHKRSQGERSDAWNSLLNGNAKIAIGARSAIFSPIKNLGLIIVDEEHDNSYKQTEEAPTYNAKHLAIMRAKLTNSIAVIASATPSVESYYNALNNKYNLSSLTKRANNASIPKVHIIDMKTELLKTKTFSYFSAPLLSAIKSRYEKGEQTLIFLNKRGYHTSIICTDCSHSFKCVHCDVNLTYHKKENILLCHMCSYSISANRSCPLCQSKQHIKFKGFGTENVEINLKRIFPQIRTLRVDRDTTSKKNSHEDLFKQFKAGKADVLIGTQMIVKGLHFPSVTLVGVLNTDSALNIPDFRASENVFSLLTQVSGRAGRADLKGEVFIQTFMPENETILLAKDQDYLSFYNKEIENRKIFGYPPFSSIIKFVFSSKKFEILEDVVKRFRSKLILQLPKDYIIHPIVEPFTSKIKDKYILQFLIRGKKTHIISKAIEKTKKEVFLPSSIHLLIDIDPIMT